MTPYNVMTNLETSDTGVTVVTDYSYYQVLCQCMDTLTIVKNGKAVHKVMLKYNTIVKNKITKREINSGRV